jgi:cytoskeletal protein CcmA (bactofilin family)
MQSITLFIIIAMQLVNPGQDAGMMPEIVVTAPRYENEDIAWCGMMPETTVMAPRSTDEEIAQMETTPEIVVSAARDQYDMIPEDHPVYTLVIDRIQPVHTLYDIYREFSLFPRLASAQTIPDVDLDNLDIDVNIKPMKGISIAGDYHLSAGDTVHDDVTISGGSALIDGVVDGDVAVMGGEVTINGMIHGDVAVMGGNCDISGTVDGDAAIFGGNLRHKGSLTGDVFVVGGTVALDSGSIVEGDISMIGGAMDRNEHAIVNGEVTSIEVEAIHKLLPRISRVFRLPGHFPGGHVFPRLFFISMLIVIFIVTLLVMIIFPQAVDKITTSLQHNVWASIGLGLALQVLYLPLILLFAISIIGIPLIPVFALAVFLAIMFGTAALSLIIGERVAKSFKWNVESKVGIFCIGWIAAMILPIIVFLIGPPIFVFGIFILYVIITIGTGGVVWALIRKKSPAPKK